MRIENWRRAKNTHNLLACEEGNYVYCSKVFVDSICNRFGIDIQLANVEQAVGEVFMTRRVFQAFEPILGPARTAFLAGILVTEFANREVQISRHLSGRSLSNTSDYFWSRSEEKKASFAGRFSSPKTNQKAE